MTIQQSLRAHAGAFDERSIFRTTMETAAARIDYLEERVKLLSGPTPPDAGKGGPAFPFHYDAGGHEPNYVSGKGMTLRDWFAGHALAGLLAFPGTIRGCTNKRSADVVSEAFIFADDMLKERAK